MTIRELLTIIEPNKNRLDDKIVVYLSGKGFPARSYTEVVSATFGFDWESGKFILATKDRVAKKGE